MRETFLFTANDSGYIQHTNYWKTAFDVNGWFHLSTHEGIVRLLIPNALKYHIEEMTKGVSYVILSVLPKEEWTSDKFSAEIVFEDNSDDPFSIDMSGSQIQIEPPTEEETQRVHTFRAFKQGHDGEPELCIDLPLFIRYVRSLPFLKPLGWKDENISMH